MPVKRAAERPHIPKFWGCSTAHDGKDGEESRGAHLAV